MNTPAKAVITTCNKTFFGDGVLTLQLSGEGLHEAKQFVTLRGLRPGSPILFQLLDKESKSYKQLKTIHLLLRIYDKFLQANVPEYIDIADLKNKIKYKYGVIEYWTAPDDKVMATLKSFADYKMSEMADVISGLFDEMIKLFAEYRYSDGRFDSMVQEFNSKPIEVDEKIELF